MANQVRNNLIITQKRVKNVISLHHSCQLLVEMQVKNQSVHPKAGIPVDFE